MADSEEPEGFGPGPVDQIESEAVAAGEETTPAPGGEAEERKRRRRGRRGGRRRRRGHGEAGESEPGQDELAAENGAPLDATEGTEEEETAGVTGEAASEVAFSEFVAEAYEPPAAAPPLPEPSAERIEAAEPEPAAAPHTETPAPEPERSPAAYNVPPTHEVSGPPANPRRGWWRRR
jgi:ribonuclease E